MKAYLWIHIKLRGAKQVSARDVGGGVQIIITAPLQPPQADRVPEQGSAELNATGKARQKW